MRRSAFLATAPLLACLGSGCDARPGTAFDLAAFEGMASRPARIRQAWDTGRAFSPFILGGIRHALDGLEFEFGISRDRMTTAVISHGEWNLLLYASAMWAKYDLGDLFRIESPGGALRANPFASGSTEDSIQALQSRGARFYACDTALAEHARTIAAARNSPAAHDDIARDLRENLVPGVLLVPSAVGALVYLQSRGFAYITD